MPGNIGPLEIGIVLVIALLVFGPKRLPELGKSLGKGIREFKGSISGDHDDDDEKSDKSDEQTQIAAAAPAPAPAPAPPAPAAAAPAPAAQADEEREAEVVPDKSA